MFASQYGTRKKKNRLGVMHNKVQTFYTTRLGAKKKKSGKGWGVGGGRGKKKKKRQ